MDDRNEEKEQIKLDGSFGPGSLAELTVITRSGEGEKEETFVFPYNFINFDHLHGFDRMNLIKGYKIVKQEKPSALKELGL